MDAAQKVDYSKGQNGGKIMEFFMDMGAIEMLEKKLQIF